MGRSKPAPIYKPQAKTAHIKRVYSGEYLPPSYEIAVAQYQQSSYNANYHAPAMQQPTYSAPAIQQPIFNMGTGWDAWGAKLAEEEHYYGGCFFAADQPMDIVVPDSATNIFNNPPDDISCVDVPMLTPSPSVVSMDVDGVDVFLMNVDDPNGMDVDLIIITTPAEVAFVRDPPVVANNLNEVPKRSSCNTQQQNKRQAPPVAVNPLNEIPKSSSCNAQQQNKWQTPPVFIPARSIYSPETLKPVQVPSPRPSPPKVPERSPLPKVTAKASKSVAVTGSALTKDVERVIESFRRLQLSDTILPPSKPPIDRITLAGSPQISCASSEDIQSTIELVTFSSEDLVNLSNAPMHSTPFTDTQPTFTGVWEDLASLERAFIRQAIPQADVSAVELVPLSEITKQYSSFFDLRDTDWELASKTTPAPEYLESQVENVVYTPVTVADPQKRSPSKKFKSHIKITSRRYKTKPKKTLILGLPLNTLQQNRRKNKLTSALANITKRIYNAKKTYTVNKVSPTQSTGDHLIRKALANARLETPRHSTAVVETVASNKKGRASLSTIHACVQTSPLSLPPVKEVAEVPSYTKRSYISFSTSFAIAPSSRSIRESPDLYDEDIISSSTPSPPAKHVKEVPTHTSRYTSFSLSFSIAPSTSTLQELADPCDEEVSSLVPLESAVPKSCPELPCIRSEPPQALEVVENDFPGAFPMVEDNVRDYRGLSFLAWLSLHVLGW